jgi:hypothetical protein
MVLKGKKGNRKSRREVLLFLKMDKKWVFWMNRGLQ